MYHHYNCVYFKTYSVRFPYYHKQSLSVNPAH